MAPLPQDLLDRRLEGWTLRQLQERALTEHGIAISLSALHRKLLAAGAPRVYEPEPEHLEPSRPAGRPMRTRRNLRIMRAVEEGCLQREIAEDFGLSLGRVKKIVAQMRQRGYSVPPCSTHPSPGVADTPSPPTSPGCSSDGGSAPSNSPT